MKKYNRDNSNMEVKGGERMNIFAVINEYLNTCPYITKINDVINVEGGGHLIHEVAIDPLVKKYINGDVEKRYDFIIETKGELTDENILMISNSGFSTDFTRWLEEQNSCGNLPKVEGIEIEKIEAITTGYVEDRKYKLKCKLIYLQRVEEKV